MDKYAKLKPEWLLRGWSDKPFNLLNWKTGDWYHLNQTSHYVLQSCDGLTNFNSFAFTGYHNKFLEELIQLGLVELCACGDTIDASQRYRKAANPYISGIHWAITGLCNLNCRHCLMESPSGRYGEPTFATVENIISQLEAANVHSISLTGGEPFLRPDILKILELLTKKQIWVRQIFTNGTLVTDEILQSIHDLGIATNFQISFDGCQAHDYMRGQAEVEPAVIAAIERVMAAGFPVIISTSIDRLNKDRMLDTYELLKNMGIQVWRIAAPQKTGNWENTSTAITLAEEAAIYESILQVWIRDNKPFNIQLSGFFKSQSQIEITVDGSIAESEKLPGVAANYALDDYDCGCCTEQPYLLPDGVLLPCCAYTGTKLQNQMPNILAEDLSKVWQSSKLRSVINLKKKDLLAEISECAACELFAQCGTGCRALAMIETGELMQKDPLTCVLWQNGYRERFLQILDGR